VKDRYVFLRSKALSVDFFALMQKLFGPEKEDQALKFSSKFLHDFGRSIGKSDVTHLTSGMDLTPSEKIFLLPNALANTGWGKMDIMLNSKLAKDDFVMTYNLHSSCEAESWLSNGSTTPNFPVCVVSIGYCTGWSSSSLGIPLVGLEVSCKSTKHSQQNFCTFMVSTPEHIEQHVIHYLTERNRMNELEVLQNLLNTIKVNQSQKQESNQSIIGSLTSALKKKLPKK